MLDFNELFLPSPQESVKVFFIVAPGILTQKPLTTMVCQRLFVSEYQRLQQGGGLLKRHKYRFTRYLMFERE